jgi:hypothetical protein
MDKTKLNDSSGKLLKYKRYRVKPDGSYIEDDGDELTVQTDPDGYTYADDGWDHVYIDELIALAHRFKRKLDFQGSEGYYISHKDGNLENYEPSNLEWKQVSETEQTKAGHVYFYNHYVGKDGSIFVYCGKDIEKGQIRERWLDDDLDATWIFESPVMYTYEKGFYHPDEYMAKAGYVAGDKTALTNPVILHRDLNVGNYNSDNLEYVESDDPRYIEYDALRKQRQKDLIKKYNTDLGYQIPSNWPQ